MVSPMLRTIASTSGRRVHRPRTLFSPILLFSKSMASSTWIPDRYPQSRRSDHVDTYKSESKGEVKVHDPYQWLEHNSEETDRWISEQEQFTRNYLDAHSDRKKLQDAIRASNDYPKLSAPTFMDDSRWYWYYNSGLQAHSVLYRSTGAELPNSLEKEGEVFFDPNFLSEDGTVSLSTTAFSKDGKYCAYGISRSGSDFFTVYVRLTSAPFAHKGPEGSPRPSHDDQRLSDEIGFVKFSSLVWTHDSKGFFYQMMPPRKPPGFAAEHKTGIETTSDYDAELYYHRVGTPQSLDVLVMKDPEHREWHWQVEISEIDGRYLSLYISKDTSRKYCVWIADLHENEIGPNMKWIKVIDKFEANYEILANKSTLFYFLTNKDAPQHKIITIDIADPTFEHKDLIPEDQSANLESALAVDKYLVVTYKRNVIDEIYIHSLVDGKHIERVASDFVGTVSISGHRDRRWFFATLTGFTTPGIIAQYTFGDNEKGVGTWRVHQTTEVKGLALEDFSSEQVWYESADGTKIPMFIVRYKDTPSDGTAPAVQYGYGGFTISINPFFSPAILTFLRGYRAILAVPNIRGGGEFGESWHLGGMLERKVNCFDDFIAASRFLVENKYAAAEKIALNGGSNGGLLVAACVNRAPYGTFGAAVAEVGVLDLLKFSEFTIGRAWTSDYGDPQNPHDFDFIYPISPIHNVPTDRTLPPTILFTADHDDRVVPLHSFKHAATLQNTLPKNPHPLLIRIEKKAGHGGGKSTEQRILSSVDKFGFIAHSLGLQWKD